MEIEMSDAPAVSTYAVFWLYRLDPHWRRLPAEERRRGKQEFLAALATRDARVTLRGAYSLVGLRPDADLLLWVYGADLDAIQRLAVDLGHTGLGTYLTSAYTYVGAAGGGRYDPEHRASFMQGLAPRTYLSMYPFVKTADWYLLPYERRRALMAEHGEVGRRYTPPRGHAPAHGDPHAGTAGSSASARRASRSSVAVAASEAPATGGVLTNTVDAYGLGDYEFIVAFESDNPTELVRMVEDLRSVEVRRYTRLDTPIFLGRRRDPADALEDL
jgi:chlorite dismutase